MDVGIELGAAPMPSEHSSDRAAMPGCCALAIEFKCKTSICNINKRLQNNNEQIEYK